MLATLGIAATLLLTAFQQQPEIRVEVEAVNVFVTVIDEDGRFVTDLNQDRFIVYEDQVPQEIINFSSSGELPLRIALLMDTSASIKLKMDFEKEAAINFVQSVMRRRDQALLVDFDRGVSLVQDFTSSPTTLIQAIQSLRAGGGTAIYDALYEVSRDKMTDRDARKAIVLLSDGEDRNSKRSLEETLEMIQVSEATVYSIGTSRFGASSSARGEDNLEYLAEETGGRAFFPYSANRLEAAFDRIDRELRSQYTLTYEPEDTVPDGRFRKIEVRIIDGEEYELRHRRGYQLPDF